MISGVPSASARGKSARAGVPSRKSSEGLAESTALPFPLSSNKTYKQEFTLPIYWEQSYYYITAAEPLPK